MNETSHRPTGTAGPRRATLKSFLWILAFAAVAAPAAPNMPAGRADAGEAVALQTAAGADLSAVLLRAGEAVENGEPAGYYVEDILKAATGQPEALPAVVRRPDAPPAQKLVAAAALMRRGEQSEGVAALADLVVRTDISATLRLAAARALGSRDAGEQANKALYLMVNYEELPERVRVALADGLLRNTNNGQDILDQLRREAGSPIARAEALLALASTMRFDRLKNELRELAGQPGPLGRHAQALLNLNDAYVADTRNDQYVDRVMTEVLGNLRTYYDIDLTDPDEDKQLDPKSIATVAAKATLRSIDPYNDFLDDEDLTSLEAQMTNHYGGIGAWVGMRDGHFMILTPMFNRPAADAGLRPMDVVLRVDDQSIRGKSQNDIIKMLKGRPGTKVKIQIARRGWEQPVDFHVARALIPLETVVGQMLPGGIAYVRILNFSDGDPRNKVRGTAWMLADLLEQFDREGAKGLVLDLQNNPGGVLISAVSVARVFLGDDKLVATVKYGKRANGGNEYHKTARRARFDKDFIYRKPMVVLINGGSASAAEILAGALKDHKRAVLVGEKSFGKGSVQQIIPVRAAKGRAQMKLTVAKWYLPDGVCLHRQGIKPDVDVDEPAITAGEAESRWQLRDQHDIQFWLEEGGRWQRDEALLRRLLDYDSYNPDHYLGLDELTAQLKKKYPRMFLDREIVRKEIRYGVGAYLRDYKGESWHIDPLESYTLQEALMVLGPKIGGLPNLPFYTSLPARVDENRRRAAEDKRQAEMQNGHQDLPIPEED